MPQLYLQCRIPDHSHDQGNVTLPDHSVSAAMDEGRGRSGDGADLRRHARALPPGRLVRRAAATAGHEVATAGRLHRLARRRPERGGLPGVDRRLPRVPRDQASWRCACRPRRSASTSTTGTAASSAPTRWPEAMRRWGPSTRRGALLGARGRRSQASGSSGCRRARRCKHADRLPRAGPGPRRDHPAPPPLRLRLAVDPPRDRAALRVVRPAGQRDLLIPRAVLDRWSRLLPQGWLEGLAGVRRSGRERGRPGDGGRVRQALRHRDRAGRATRRAEALGVRRRRYQFATRRHAVWRCAWPRARLEWAATAPRMLGRSCARGVHAWPSAEAKPGPAAGRPGRGAARVRLDVGVGRVGRR
jgi:hypothetical protein